MKDHIYVEIDSRNKERIEKINELFNKGKEKEKLFAVKIEKEEVKKIFNKESSDIKLDDFKSIKVDIKKIIMHFFSSHCYQYQFNENLQSYVDTLWNKRKLLISHRQFGRVTTKNE